eukprot:scaffold115589_cov30-Prasinocladus_malaysianus.AAC.1
MEMDLVNKLRLERLSSASRLPPDVVLSEAVSLWAAVRGLSLNGDDTNVFDIVRSMVCQDKVSCNSSAQFDRAVLYNSSSHEATVVVVRYVVSAGEKSRIKCVRVFGLVSTTSAINFHHGIYGGFTASTEFLF